MKTIKCPKCEGNLSLDDKVVLCVKSKDGQKGLMFLSPEVGDYAVSKQDDMDIKEGDELQVLCPLCHENLLAVADKKLARVDMIADGESYTVLFSVKYGEKSTYTVKDKEIKGSFGKHRDPDIDIDIDSLFMFGGGMM